MLVLTCTLLFTMVIHTADSLSYALRLGGLRARRIGLAVTVAGMLLLVSRTSNMIQGPMLGSMADQAKLIAQEPLEWKLHAILAAATAGTLLAILLFPAMVRISARLVVHLEAAGSVGGMVRRLVQQARWRHIGYYVKRPDRAMAHSLLHGSFPKRLVLLNLVVTAVYTVGVLSAVYASYLWPEHATSMSMSSGLINGGATILLTLLIDPRLALLSERAVRGDLRLAGMNRIYGWMLVSRLGGTLLAQLLLVPFAYWIGWMIG
ncbi:lipid II flippase Amj family protein [Paenibacillus sp. P96]|uniref:Lipid II flippase Amj n=1 Tax=Paenibacillus zeirhizosphaerae TaxID=2987519 RepID=A0ABT9FPZ6_9BACL|nr:DUF2837 family protein [Paenibacillus sp. P96]MDP4096793.1 lipid II flippase Amj family protein [Paenibacillus sp. P96]